MKQEMAHLLFDCSSTPMIWWKDAVVLQEELGRCKKREVVHLLSISVSTRELKDVVVWQEELGRSMKQEVAHLLSDSDSTRELFAKAGRQHTRLSATEYQCWVGVVH